MAQVRIPDPSLISNWRDWARLLALEFEKFLRVLSSQLIASSKIFDPVSLADGVGVTTTVTVPGAVLGDFVEASFSLDLQGIMVTAWVSSADTVSVRFQNESGGVLDLASGTLRVRIRRA